MRKSFLPIVALLGGAVALAAPAVAADKVRVGKAVGSMWVFVPMDIGVEQGIFAKYGLDVEVSTMTGEAKMAQGLTANSLDIGLAGPQGAALSVKGAPLLGVAVLTNQPRNFAVVVAADSPIKTVADLKGKQVSGASAGGLPEWLVRHLAVTQGWGPDGIKSIALGSPSASLAAVQTHQVDAMMTATATGISLEEQGKGRIVTTMGDSVPKFHTEIIFARTGFMQDNPDVLKRFLKGVFASIDFVKKNKDKTDETAARILNLSPAIMGKIYDSEISTFSKDGSFDPEALAVLKQSFIDMAILPEKPTDDQIITTKFVPITP